jgi:hypothetical protein
MNSVFHIIFLYFCFAISFAFYLGLLLVPVEEGRPVKMVGEKCSTDAVRYFAELLFDFQQLKQAVSLYHMFICLFVSLYFSYIDQEIGKTTNIKK